LHNRREAVRQRLLVGEIGSRADGEEERSRGDGKPWKRHSSHGRVIRRADPESRGAKPLDSTVRGSFGTGEDP
jgi:hypothetical protein